jgi:hypothetical protein
MNEEDLTSMQREFKMLEECALIYSAMEPDDSDD